jgi:hypothetical protein
VEQLAELVGKKLHIINLSRISPLELEGVQMPHTTIDADGETLKLKLLHATFWTQIKAGDIVLFDELLRAFPEVFNGLLDIITSRQVAGLILPPALFLGASNSVIAYDKALEDRLLHIPVPDIRTDKKARKATAQIIIDALGLLPEMVKSAEMESLIQLEVAPMYEILDVIGGKSSAGASLKGTSVRKLIGMTKLRDIRSPQMKDLIDINNYKAMHEGKPQCVLVYDGANPPSNYETSALNLYSKHRDKLSPIQELNLVLNLQLLGLEKQRKQKGTVPTDGDDIFE